MSEQKVRGESDQFLCNSFLMCINSVDLLSPFFVPLKMNKSPKRPLMFSFPITARLALCCLLSRFFLSLLFQMLPIGEVQKFRVYNEERESDT